MIELFGSERRETRETLFRCDAAAVVVVDARCEKKRERERKIVFVLLKLMPAGRGIKPRNWSDEISKANKN